MMEIERARRGEVTELVGLLASEEGLPEQALAQSVAAGTAVVLGGAGRRPVVVGGEARVKVNANVGTSTAVADLALEAEKAALATALGARTISDCSVGGDLDRARRTLLEATDLPVLTVPIYQASLEAGGAEHVTADLFLDVARRHLDDGASGLVVHAALDSFVADTVRSRVMGMVSRGGQLTTRWLEASGLSQFSETAVDALLELLRRFDAVLILGNAARSGCVHDLLDEAHVREAHLGEELARRANERGVQVVVEAVGGHVHVGAVAEHVQLYKRQGGRPIFAAGPITVDVAVGHDHLAAAIGGALAAGAGADLLCYITPAEHIGLPSVDDVREGTIACMVAAYHGDALRRGPLARDLELAKARRRFDWPLQLELALAPDRARARHRPGPGCSMCGDLCPMRADGPLEQSSSPAHRGPRSRGGS